VVGAAVAGAGSRYAVAFDQDITHCAVVVTPSGMGDGDTVEVEKTGTEAKVYMRNGNELIEKPFSIVAHC
jgi:hypothetical protein